MKTTFFAEKNKNLLLYANNSKSLVQLNKTVVTIMETNNKQEVLPEILFVTSYPNRECGIATYTQDLIHAIKDKFGKSFVLKVCALEENGKKYEYPEEVKYILKTSILSDYYELAQKINEDNNVNLVFMEHEFGLYSGEFGEYFIELLSLINKPVITTFHTVLPNPSTKRKNVVKSIVTFSDQIVVMTQTSASILINDYGISVDKITVIQHGTHLVVNQKTTQKNNKYNFGNRFVFSTFGLLNSGKNIETALDALPKIIDKFPNVLYLIIGKTHPTVVKQEGEVYRDFLEKKVIDLGLQNNVKFINKYLPLNELLEYLQRTDIYFFTSKDPFQAVSGTFAYAMASGCAIISTPIPHAIEMLNNDAGIIVDFENAQQLSDATLKLLFNPILLNQMRLNALHKIAPTAWQNSAIAHIELINSCLKKNTIDLKYELPAISLNHIKRLTTKSGMIQFSQINVPDLATGYTIDDNARALIAIAKHYQLTLDPCDLILINTYLSYIIFCQQSNGSFLNYVDKDGDFLESNNLENLEDANGRAIWALGEFISFSDFIPYDLIEKAEETLKKSLLYSMSLTSPRAMSFAIKGLYFYNLNRNNIEVKTIIIMLADNLVSKYRGVSDSNWEWFEYYLTYANSVLPEAMLYASLATDSKLYKSIALKSFEFLLSVIFKNNQIKVISNQGWHIKNEITNSYGEQPIDVAYTIIALGSFYEVFQDKEYLNKMTIAFNWFLGKNHLHQIIYNPATGGCYDGLEEHQANLNQGAESTVSYLLARLTVEKYLKENRITDIVKMYSSFSILNKKNFMAASF